MADQYKIYRIQIDHPRVVADVVAGCCTQEEQFYAEYLVLYELPRSGGMRTCYGSKEVDRADVCLALLIAKQRMTTEGLGDINKKQFGNGTAYGEIAPGDEQHIDLLKLKYREEMEWFYKEVNAKLKCQCLKELLKPSSVGVPHLRG